MSREIKFRGKRVDNGELVFGDLIRHSGRTEILDANSQELLDYELIQIIPETVGQFTGLTDKNGREIYEGDIMDYGHKRHRPVYFTEGRFRMGDVHLTSLIPLFEIIGNIYENPELLKP